MGLFKMAAVGAIGYFAYQALQRKQAGTASIGNDRADARDERLIDDVSDTPSTDAQNNLHASPGNSVT